MNLDFTFRIYEHLLKVLVKKGLPFFSVSDYLENPAPLTIILRHDVDRLPLYSLNFARIQARDGIKGTYYFRAIPQSWNESIIKEIYSLGHEIGYHYEDVNINSQSPLIRGERRKTFSPENERYRVDIAIKSFTRNLKKLRKIVPVRSICMHGSPLNRWDSRILWKYYNYRDYGIECEPYFDIDFENILYLTDTGRRWDGQAVSVRDKAGQGAEVSGHVVENPSFRKASAGKLGLRVQGTGENQHHDDPYKDWVVKPVKGSLMNMTQESTEFQNQFDFHSTYDIIRALDENRFPGKAMVTFHPQRWTDEPLNWVKEIVLQNAKNAVKGFLIKRNS